MLHLAQQQDEQVRAAVAAHPNTPASLLAELAQQYPAQVLANPALPLLRLAQPQLLFTWPARSVECLTAQPDAPDWLLRLAASHPVIDVQLAAVVHAALPEDVLLKLAASPYWTIREYTARKPSLPSRVLHHLAGDADYGVRLTVAGRPDLTAALRRTLQHDPHPLVRAVIQLSEPGGV